MGAFKDAACSHGELLTTGVAVMPVRGRDSSCTVGIAARANYTVGPAFGFEKVDSRLLVGELLEELKDADTDVVFVVYDG